MNRFYCLFLGLFLFLADIVCGQNVNPYGFDLKITYKVSVIPDSLDKGKVWHENVEYYTSDSLNMYMSVNQYGIDSIIHHEKELRDKVSTQGGVYVYPVYPKTLISHTVFELENTLLVVDKFVDEKYYGYEEVAATDAWQLNPDSIKTINGYLCQKATLASGNRTWTAWFSADLGVQGGPYKFTGLPGLVIRVYDSTNSWSFELTGIQRDPRPVPLFLLPTDKDIQTVDKEKFYATKKYLRDNILDIKIAEGNLRFSSQKQYNETKNRMDKENEKDNNWIERY